MNITADTNIFLRIFTEDDPEQARRAKAELESASSIAVPIPILCELVWSFRTGYKLSARVAAAHIRTLLTIATVETDRDAALAGLAILDAGGDFADGVIAHQGRKLGGEIFLSFDAQAIKLLSTAGEPARTPAL